MTMQLLIEQHREAAAKSMRLTDWVKGEAEKVKTSLGAALDRHASDHPEVLRIRDQELERLKASVELVDSAIEESNALLLQLRIVAWAQDHITDKLAAVLLEDPDSAAKLAAVIRGFYILLGRTGTVEEAK